MKLKMLRMSSERYDRLKAQARAQGFRSTGQFVESLLDQPPAPQEASGEMIEREVNRRAQTSRAAPLGHLEHPARSFHTSEDCARVMLNTLPEGTRNFAYEICEHILHIQPSQLIHGHLMNAADSGLLQSPHIDPSWEIRKTQEQTGQSVCEWRECRRSFMPGYYGQRYCGPLCGGKAATEMLPTPAPKTQPIITDERIQSQGLVAV